MIQDPHRVPREADAGVASPTDGASPVMAQFLALKETHKEFLLFFRMGDFYEMFFDDAVTAAAALDIALTKRGKHQGRDIPMCGVPVHAADAYLARLIRKGHKVAICEQLEDPAEARKRGSKAVVARDVVRIITPGTLSEDTLLAPERHNYLAALARVGGADGGQLALAWIDMSTGDCHVAASSPERLAADLARITPGELLVPDGLLADERLTRVIRESGGVFTALPSARFDSEAASARLAAHYGVAALDGFGALTRAERSALGAVFDYLSLTQRGHMPRLKPPRREADGVTLLIDAQTRANLELTQSSGGARRGSLLADIDQTRTGAGARLLAERLVSPLADPAEIAVRQDAVAFFLAADSLRERVDDALRGLPDLARALQRLALARGGPRDLAALALGLDRGANIAAALAEPAGLIGAPPQELMVAGEALRGFEALIETLRSALAEDLPLFARDGGFIRAGYHPPLDETRSLRDEGRRVVLTLEARYREQASIANLKIRHNNVLGYFIEVSATHADKMLSAPLSQTFMHRQTLANAARFTTPELGELEQRIARAGDTALALELELFSALCSEALARADDIAAAAEGLARLDVACALARLARERRWVRPDVDTSLDFEIEGGRHPMVETALTRAGEAPFVANDCKLSGEGGRLWLVTGPNMAGKSTFLRQTALITILAQMGSYVPARRARLGAADRLFSRVGAADDLARGRSTFMVEMIETAAILNQAGPRSLVILDEIGRGTATYDGLSIAWATLEHLHNVNRSRGLFATHYHELTALTQTLEQLSAVTMRVREWKGEVIFLHEVIKGTADRSYGVHVAKLAGLPQPVIARAEEILSRLESGADGGSGRDVALDLPLFAPRPPAPPKPTEDPLRTELRELSPDALSPREALDLLYGLVARAREGS